MGIRKFPFKTGLKMTDPIVLTLDAADAYVFVNWLLENSTDIDGAGAAAKFICEQIITQLFGQSALKAAEAEFEHEQTEGHPLMRMFQQMGVPIVNPFPNPEDFREENDR